ncbi:MarR family transcriptional regulator [Pyrolobus fumarii]
MGSDTIKVLKDIIDSKLAYKYVLCTLLSSEREFLTTSELGSILQYSTSYIRRIVKEMEEKGLVILERLQPDDRILVKIPTELKKI